MGDDDDGDSIEIRDEINEIEQMYWLMDGRLCVRVLCDQVVANEMFIRLMTDKLFRSVEIRTHGHATVFIRFALSDFFVFQIQQK